MAQKRKKTNPPRTPVKRNSKAFKDKMYAALRKVLQVYGFEPNLLDSFSKSQRQLMTQSVISEQIRFRVAEGHRVPGRIVDFVAESVQRNLRKRCFGDESIGLTYYELYFYGLPFSATVKLGYETRVFPPAQMEIIDRLAACFCDDRIEKDLAEVGMWIRHTMLMVTKVNFRIYGFDWRIGYYDTGVRTGMRSEVRLSSEPPRITYFTYKQKERQAFGISAGRIITTPLYHARISSEEIDLDYTGRMPEYLDIYIQSHALQRAKERMDIFPAHVRNYYIMESLLYMHRVNVSQSGHPLIECYTTEDDTYVRFGYFPFVIRKEKLIVTTFLPMAAPDTTEGWFLHHKLGLEKEDMKFLGMDKLSFYCSVDFNQIPALKAVIEGMGMRSLITYAANHTAVDCPIDPKRTQMVKRFIEQKIDFDKQAAVPG